jgi:hypothetical protein
MEIYRLSEKHNFSPGAPPCRPEGSRPGTEKQDEGGVLNLERECVNK